MTNMDPRKLEDILTRSIFSVLPSKEAFKKELGGGRRLRIYIGADPTGPDLHLGHATNFIFLEKLRELGHEIVVLFGDFTAMIGDPTGKDAARKRLTPKEVQENIKTWKKQVEKVLSFSDKKNPAKIKKNSTWLSKLMFSDIVELSAHFTLQQMIERDMFQKRIKEKKPIYLHEFFYPLMQGYDSVAMNVDVEVGGSDQIFNMGIGRALQKKINNKEKYVIATTLLENPKTGKKLMSKSAGSYIALNDEPKEMYGKAMALPDEVIVPMFTDTTRVSMGEILEIKKTLKKGEDFHRAKMRLAYELVKMYHDEKSAEKSQKDFIQMFQKKGLPEEVFVVYAKKTEALVAVVVRAGKVGSKSSWRRLVEQGGVSNMNTGEKIKDYQEKIKGNMVVKIGKKDFLNIKIKR